MSKAGPPAAWQCCSFLLVLLASLAFARSASAANYAAVANASDRTSLLSAVVDEMMNRRSSSDRRYFANGVWYGAGTDCARCRVGPGIGAAALVPRRPELLPVAVATMDRAIALHQAPDGSFGEPIDTTWFANALGMTYVLLDPYLDPATRARWATALMRAADHLVATGHLAYYVNGNINLSITETMWLAARITGDPRYAQAFEASWAFTLAPAQATWPGYGLRWFRLPARPDWSDGAGYLGEAATAASPPGFDPEYTQVQLDVASSLYVLSRDPRVLSLMNALVNGLVNRVDATAALDSSNGTRRSGRVPFLTPALDLLAANGGRADLQSRLPAQFTRARNDYDFVLGTTTAEYEPGFYGGVGTWLAVPVIDIRYRPVPAAPATAAAPAQSRRTASRRATRCPRHRRASNRRRYDSRVCRRHRARARARARERRAARREAERRRHRHQPSS